MTRILSVLQTMTHKNYTTVKKKADTIQIETMIMKDFGQLSKKKKTLM